MPTKHLLSDSAHIDRMRIVERFRLTGPAAARDSARILVVFEWFGCP